MIRLFRHIGWVSLLLLTACNTSSSTAPTPSPVTAIDSFGANPNPSPLNVAVAFSWSVSGQALTCHLDADNNGTDDYTIQNCSSASRIAHTYGTQGIQTARLKVSGSDGQTLTQTTQVTVAAPNEPPSLLSFDEAPVADDELGLIYTWSATDPDGDQPYCQFDAESDGVWDYQGLCSDNGATSVESTALPKRSFKHKFARKGVYNSTLEVSDPYSKKRGFKKVRVPYNRKARIKRLSAVTTGQFVGRLDIEVADEDNDSLTCRLNVKGIGRFTYNNCRKLSRNFKFTGPGRYEVSLEVDDGIDQLTERTFFEFTEDGDKWKLPGYTSLYTGYHNCYLNAPGTLYCWGANWNKQMAVNNTTDRPVPFALDMSAVPGGVFREVTILGGSTCGLTPAGTAYCWGSDQYGGELGDGPPSNADSPTPVAVDMSGVTGGVFSELAAGTSSTVCGLTPAGTAYCWGRGTDGQLGDGGNSDQPAPVAVDMTPVPGGVFASIIGANKHMCALNPAGLAYCWGQDQSGKLGDDATIANKNLPTPVDMSAVDGGSFVLINAGEEQTCGLSASGKAYCWGDNAKGQLGVGDTTYRPVPTAVNMASVAGGTFWHISSGVQHVCGLTPAGKAYCWGWNNDSQLGVGDTADRNLPTAVNMSGVEGSVFARLQAGGYITCGLTPSLKIYCWGDDANGAVGDNATLADAPIPAPVDMSAIALP